MDFFRSITWSQYLEFILIACVIFYAYVGVRYFRVEIGEMLAGRAGSKKKSHRLIPTYPKPETKKQLADIMGIPRSIEREEAGYSLEELEEIDQIRLEVEPSGAEIFAADPGTSLPDLSLLVDTLSRETARPQTNDEALLDRIQSLLAPFHVLANTPLRPSIEELITTRPAGEKLNAAQISTLWDDLDFENFLTEEDEDFPITEVEE